MKKPDRLKRGVEKEYQEWIKGPQVQMLIRKEHRAVLNLINKDIRRCKKIVAETDVVSDVHMQAIGEWRVLRELLAELTERAT